MQAMPSRPVDRNTDRARACPGNDGRRGACGVAERSATAFRLRARALTLGVLVLVLAAGRGDGSSGDNGSRHLDPSTAVPGCYLIDGTPAPDCPTARATAAQPVPFLVADIYPGVDPVASSSPQHFMLLDGFVLFSADDGVHGNELWRTDGTEAGTSLLADINPGSAPSITYSDVAVIDGIGYFAADDGEHGAELWRSDGTTAGTWMVKDLNPGASGSNPQLFFAAGSTLYFRASDVASGQELWRSDGSEAGTARVADINFGPADSTPAFSTYASIGGVLYFVADDGIHGCELWRSDGSDAGTRMVKDVSATAMCFEQLMLGDISWRVYLGPFSLTDVGGALFFIADHTLWKSDGTEAGTVALHNFYRSCNGFELFSCPPSCLTNVDGTLYFQAEQSEIGRELWRSDGTDAGTLLVKDINPRTCNYDDYPDQCSSFPCNFEGTGGEVFFTARGGSEGDGRWVTDGTAAGTRFVSPLPPPADPYPGAQPYPDASSSAILNGVLIYGAGELYRHDGGSQGPQLVKDIRRPPASSYPFVLAALGNSLLFAADDGQHGAELWQTDGTSDGTQLLKDILPGPNTSGPYLGNTPAVEIDGALFFVAVDEEHGLELWRTDATVSGTRLVKDIWPGPLSGFSVGYIQLFGFQRHVFFAARDGETGIGGLWRSDGTEDGTEMIANVLPSNFIEFRDHLYFTSGAQLWRTDGTRDGTAVAIDSDGYGYDFTPYGGRLMFFSSDPDTGGWQLSQTDGTNEGTSVVRRGFPGTPAPEELTTAGATLFFLGGNQNGDHRELWRSDGTESGTYRLLALTNGYIVSPLTALNGRVFFIVADLDAGESLWESDGTEPGTAPVKQISAAYSDLHAAIVATAGDSLFLKVSDGHALRLWRSDGTSEGTVPILTGSVTLSVEDFSPMAIVGGTLYFPADDGRTGVELWALPLAGTVATCRADCDGDLRVTVADLVRGVGIALGVSPLSTCVSLDQDLDQHVTVDEIVTAVREALLGCGS